MNYMDCENTVIGIVESMLPRFSGSKVGLTMTLSMEASNAKKRAGSLALSYAGLQLLFVRPSNHTKVFTRMSESGRINPTGPFKLMSDHDSCWRSEGLREIFQAVERCCNEVNPDKAFRYSDPSIRFNLFGGAPKYVEVTKVSTDPRAVINLTLTEDERYGRVPINLELTNLSLHEAVALIPTRTVYKGGVLWE